MFPYRGIMLHKIYFPVLCAQKLRMTLINEDKERHYQNSLKRLVSLWYETRTRHAKHNGREAEWRKRKPTFPLCPLILSWIELVRYLRTFRTSPFQSPSFSSSMCCKKLARRLCVRDWSSSIRYPQIEMASRLVPGLALGRGENNSWIHIFSLKFLSLPHPLSLSDGPIFAIFMPG